MSSAATVKKARRRQRSGKTAFRPRARLLRILGEELISDDVVAITELVKNAHDADATRVRLRFEAVTTPSGRIIVEDDGDGMDLDTLLGRWMEPASSDKRGRRTRKGRRMLGEKGVGRFAVDKLAAKLELVSRKRREPDELVALFDWDDYSDDSRMLSDVHSTWKLRTPELIKHHGTTLILLGLRGEWSERTFRRLCSRLSRLVPPGSRDDSFTIEVVSDEFPDYSGTLETGHFDRAPHRITASFDGFRSVLVKVNDGPSALLPWNGREDLACGPVEIQVHAFDLETESLARIGPRMEVRNWLRHWSGVSIYRDGFRVWPYGEPHDDWLRLDQRRVNNPTLRLSNNQVVGFIRITADGNPELRDQTNREGLVSNDALEHLRRLVYFVLQVLEAERQVLRKPARKERRRPGGLKAQADAPVHSEIEQLAEKAGGRLHGQIRAAIRRMRDHSERVEASGRRVIDGLAELAAAGQAATGVHELALPVMDGIERKVSSLRRGRVRAGEGGELAGLVAEVSMLRTYLSMLDPLSEAITSRRHSMDVTSELRAYRELLAPLLGARRVRMELDLPEKELLRITMRPQTFRRLLQLLLANSLDWTGRNPGSRILVRLKPAPEGCEILFSDSGPGVPPEAAATIFEPHMSLKEGGKGMGLTIARCIVEQHGGTIDLVRDGRYRGATFRIVLPRKR